MGGDESVRHEGAEQDGQVGEREEKEPSRPGVAVTAFGPNPDGAGTLLRLWELAGLGSSCQVRLPAGMSAGTIQRVDLWGRPDGPAATARDGSLMIEMKPFAPVSLVISKP